MTGYSTTITTEPTPASAASHPSNACAFTTWPGITASEAGQRRFFGSVGR